jgi:hypothetical protein
VALIATNIDAPRHHAVLCSQLDIGGGGGGSGRTGRGLNVTGEVVGLFGIRMLIG